MLEGILVGFLSKEIWQNDTSKTASVSHHFSLPGKLEPLCQKISGATRPVEISAKDMPYLCLWKPVAALITYCHRNLRDIIMDFKFEHHKMSSI